MAQAEKLLQEAAAQGRVTEAVTPEGFKIPVDRDGEFVAEPFVAAMEGETPRAGTMGKPGAEVRPVVVNWSEVEEVAKHNSTFKVQVPKGAQEIHVEFLEDNIQHMLDERPGHLPDTPANRKLFLDLAAEQKNYFAKPDSHGTLWCEKFLDNGTQLWVQVRDGKIRNCGHNKIPKKWDPETGLARNIKK